MHIITKIVRGEGDFKTMLNVNQTVKLKLVRQLVIIVYQTVMSVYAVLTNRTMLKEMILVILTM